MKLQSTFGSFTLEALLYIIMICWSSFWSRFGVGSKIQPTPHFIQKGSLNGLFIGINSFWSRRSRKSRLKIQLDKSFGRILVKK